MEDDRTLKSSSKSIHARTLTWGQLTNWIMQTQSRITVSPLVPYARLLLDNQSGDIQKLESSCNLKSTLSTTNHEDLGIGVQKLSFPLSLLFPFSVVRVRVSQRASLFRIVLQVPQVSIHRERSPNTVGLGNQVEDTIADANLSLERESTPDPRDVGVGPFECGINELNVVELRECEAVLQKLPDGLLAMEGAEVPCQSQHIPPPAVLCEDIQNAIDVPRRDMLCEGPRPL